MQYRKKLNQNVVVLTDHARIGVMILETLS